ncbi:tetratricopeptide repeat protein [Nonomuraea sp. NPDC050556]|uniref:AfsR/SARP family transcriptional regulator n=1 Tax=Nonomuraea sp. NPDC050556 TaxID=3364369 RepID=UPI00378D21DB
MKVERLRFAILGPVEVSAGRPLAPRHRAVLAYLLLNARIVVSADRLADAMWGQTPPDTSRAQIHAAITAIRKMLREADAEEVLSTRPGGYLITSANLDLDEFNERVSAAQLKDPAEAAAAIRQALTLWRGEPLADLNADFVPGARARLTDRRLAAVEQLAELELELGRHNDLIDELAAEVAAHPVRERLAGRLMLALHRAGRQADALAVARTLRETLADQQGLDPGRAFTDLEQAILRDDPAIAASHSPPPKPPAPAAIRANYLPYDTPDFAGRTAELDRLAERHAGSAGVVTIAAIDGMAGIGKTAFAVHTAHRLAGRFPDGQLFVDLQAHTAGQVPVDPGAALEILLRQLAVPAERIPASVTDRAALWRAELADRRVLVVLDNAADTEHVRPLLPGATSGMFLITSRRRLLGLDGAHTLSMEALPAGDAVELFNRIVGERARAEPIAVLDVLQLCGFLPLAVRIAAARLHHRGQWTVSYLAHRLMGQRRRLTELSTADRGVAAAFTLSYQQLDPDQQRMFRLLGLHPGRDIDIAAAAALADVPMDDAEALLEDLLDTHMLLQLEPGRYTFHDLLREHARDLAAADQGTEAVARLLDHYRDTAVAAVTELYPYIAHRMPAVPHVDPLLGATDWLEAERANLIAAAAHAADNDWPAHASQLAAILYHYLDRRGYHTDARTLHDLALRAARRTGDRQAEGHALIDLSEVSLRQGRPEEATSEARQALEICREIGDRLGEALALNRLGHVSWRRHDYAQAHERYARALELCREIGDPVGEAAGLDNLGTVCERQGAYEQAVEHHQQAMNLYRGIGSVHGESDARDNLALVYRRLGQYDLAREHHSRALDLYHELGYRSDEARARNGLGAVARAVGDPELAIEEHEAALTLAREVGNQPEQARAHEGLAHAHRALGRLDAARAQAELALDLYTHLDVPEAEEIRCFLTQLP